MNNPAAPLTTMEQALRDRYERQLERVIKQCWAVPDTARQSQDEMERELL